MQARGGPPDVAIAIIPVCYAMSRRRWGDEITGSPWQAATVAGTFPPTGILKCLTASDTLYECVINS